MEIVFKNKVILVTGSTSGIGKQKAKQLLESKANVIIFYGHNEKMAEETMKELAEYKENNLLVKADLSNENDVNMLFNEISKKYDRFDVLVNCAAYDKVLSIEELTVNEYRYKLNVNLIARWQCIKNAIPLMKKVGGSQSIYIASRLGTRPTEHSVAYCTSEAATIMLTQCCALELAKYNIRVNTVGPSLTLTPLGT